MCDKFIVVIDQGPRSKKHSYWICKRHPDGNYYVESKPKYLTEAVSRVKELNEFEAARLARQAAIERAQL